MAMNDDMKEYVMLCADVLLQVQAIARTHPLWPHLTKPDRPRMATVFLETEVPLLAGEAVEFDFQHKGLLKSYRGRGRVIRSGPNGAAVSVLEVMSLDKPIIRNSQVVSRREQAGDTSRKIAALPDNAKIEQLLASLIGDKIKVSDKSGSERPNPPVVGVYVDDNGQRAAMAVSDVATANNLGAALARIPAGATAAAIRSNRVENEFLENFQEVLNIGASMFNLSDGAHIKFSEIYAPPGKLPSEITASMNTPRARKVVQLVIPLYGTGTMSLMLV